MVAMTQGGDSNTYNDLRIFMMEQASWWSNEELPWTKKFRNHICSIILFCGMVVVLCSAHPASYLEVRNVLNEWIKRGPRVNYACAVHDHIMAISI